MAGGGGVRLEDTIVVAEFLSLFVAATYTVFPRRVMPVTVTGEPAIEELSAGLVTVSGVARCVLAT